MFGGGSQPGNFCFGAILNIEQVEKREKKERWWKNKFQAHAKKKKIKGFENIKKFQLFGKY